MHVVPRCPILDPNIVNSTQTRQWATHLECYSPYGSFWATFHGTAVLRQPGLGAPCTRTARTVREAPS